MLKRAFMVAVLVITPTVSNTLLATTIVERVQSNYNVYVGSTGTNEIFEFTPEGTFVRKFGAGYVNRPEHIVFDSSGNLYVSDGYSGTIRKFDRYGDFADEFTVSGLQYASGMTIDDAGLVYVSDDPGNQIHVLTTSGIQTRTISANGRPDGLTIGSNDTLFAALRSTNSYVFEYQLDGVQLGQFTQSSIYSGIEGIAFDKNDFLYATANNEIKQFDSQGSLVKSISGGSLQGAEQIAVFADNNVYVSSYFSSKVQVFDWSGTFLFDFGGNGLSNAYALAFGPAIIPEPATFSLLLISVLALFRRRYR